METDRSRERSSSLQGEVQMIDVPPAGGHADEDGGDGDDTETGFPQQAEPQSPSTPARRGRPRPPQPDRHATEESDPFEAAQQRQIVELHGLSERLRFGGTEALRMISLSLRNHAHARICF